MENIEDFFEEEEELEDELPESDSDSEEDNYIYHRPCRA